MLGWMAPMRDRRRSRASIAVQVLPRSLLRSKWTRHLLGFSSVSLLVGQRMSPFASCTGLFLIGPRMPSGSLRAALQVVPPSSLVLQLAPPGLRARADFVEEHQRPVLRLEEHGVPAGMPRAVGLHAVGRLHRCGPLAIDEARDPDADVGILLRGAAEPRGDQAVLAFRRSSWRGMDGNGPVS